MNQELTALRHCNRVWHVRATFGKEGERHNFMPSRDIYFNEDSCRQRGLTSYDAARLWRVSEAHGPVSVLAIRDVPWYAVEAIYDVFLAATGAGLTNRRKPTRRVRYSTAVRDYTAGRAAQVWVYASSEDSRL